MSFAQSIQITKDLSPTLFSEQFQQTYHSIHGAIAESEHVFIQNGLEEIAQTKSEISIFEMGFGTGLNAALSWDFAINNILNIYYETIELYPVENQILENFKTPNEDLNKKINKLHQVDWEINHSLDKFNFSKHKIDLDGYNTNSKFDLIYFDAFGPRAQPELWTEEVFHKMYNLLKPNGILTTYCAQGQAKRNLKAAGFSISNPPGPIGKREMTIARKVANN